MIDDSRTAGVVGPETGTVVGLRLHSRTQVTPRWVADAVVPAARALREVHGVPIVYLGRGWLRGPHVDLVARADPGRELPWSEIADLLRPGTVDESSALDEAVYLAQARELGRLERVPPPYLPMRSHGTVQWLGPDDVATWPEPLGTLREVALSRLGEPLLGALEAPTGTGPGVLRIAEAFVALADAHPRGIGYGVFSLRSHAEAFFAWAGPHRDPRPAFGQRLQADAPGLGEFVEQIVRGEPNRGMRGWQAAFAYCLGAFDGAVANGTLTSAGLDGIAGDVDPATMGPAGGVAAQPTPSAFHEAVNASGVTDDPPARFASYRLLINLFYRQLPLLGVAPMQRYYLCCAIADIVDDVLGESWRDRLSRGSQWRTAAGLGGAR